MGATAAASGWLYSAIEKGAVVLRVIIAGISRVPVNPVGRRQYFYFEGVSGGVGYLLYAPYIYSGAPGYPSRLFSVIPGYVLGSPQSAYIPTPP